MSRSDIHRIKVPKDIASNLGCDTKNVFDASKICKREGTIDLLEAGYNCPLRSTVVRQLEFVREEENLTKMFNSFDRGFLQEHPILTENEVEVSLQKCRDTSVVMRVFKLSWQLEPQVRKSKIKSLPKLRKSLGQEREPFAVES